VKGNLISERREKKEVKGDQTEMRGNKNRAKGNLTRGRGIQIERGELNCSEEGIKMSCSVAVPSYNVQIL